MLRRLRQKRRLTPKNPKAKPTQRKRRTAYSSGRREVVGIERSPVQRKTRERYDKNQIGSALNYTPFRSNFRWRQH